MVHIITGALGLIMFLLFVGGLAESIGAVPFILIVIGIGALAATAFWQDIREALGRGR